MITKKDVGKRVVVNGNVTGIEFKNEKGVINSVTPSTPAIGITFDNYNASFHDCWGECENHYGFFVHRNMITFEKIKDALLYDFSYMKDVNFKLNPFGKMQDHFYKHGFPVPVKIIETGVHILSKDNEILDTKIQFEDEICYTCARFLKPIKKEKETDMEKEMGKRVSAKGYRSGEPFEGTGKIVKATGGIFGIEFDKKLSFGHDCDGTAKDGYGWFVASHDIQVLPPGIRLKTEKIVESDGTLSRKITGFKALSPGKLPDKYMNGKKPICFIGINDNLYVANRAADFTDGYFKINEIVPEETFQKLLAHCHAAGDHLMDVNRELKKKKAEWAGTETFII